MILQTRVAFVSLSLLPLLASSAIAQTQLVEIERDPVAAPSASVSSTSDPSPDGDSDPPPDGDSDPSPGGDIAQDSESTPSEGLDPLRQMQSKAIQQQKASWGHWGIQSDRYSAWKSHSNRLIPVYTFGITLDTWREQGSAYADPERLKALYGHVPAGTLNSTATYYDQTDIWRLQMEAARAGYKHIILMVFDGMDWQTTRAAAIYQRGHVYQSGRGTGLAFLDDRRVATDFALVCTSPLLAAAQYDVNSQVVVDQGKEATGGYDPRLGGRAPWHEQSGRNYLLGLDAQHKHTVTDSASSATSLTAGVKTYNGAINFQANGQRAIPIARKLQQENQFKVGVVTSVPVSHATPAAAYANNVTRKDYQDISRDLLGLPSSSHRRDPLPGVDVLIGGGWGEGSGEDKLQGDNFIPGNPYLHQDDIQRSSLRKGGRYVVAQRSPGKPGGQRLRAAARRAAKDQHRLLGFFGTKGGHLPFRTADGRFNPTFDVKGTERYTQADVEENPTLAEMTRAALTVLEGSENGFWLMVEAGDVDWANHANNLDSSVGAVISGDDAFKVVMDWVDQQQAWDSTAVIVTADHGHFLVLEDAAQIAQAGQAAAATSTSE